MLHCISLRRQTARGFSVTVAMMTIAYSIFILLCVVSRIGNAWYTQFSVNNMHC